MFDFDLARDPFQFFRFFLGTVVTVYATIITLQSLWGWYVFLAGGDRYVSMLRRYVLVHGLRLRFGSFWGDVIICILLAVAFFMLWHAQGVLDDIDRVLGSLDPRTLEHVQPSAKHG